MISTALLILIGFIICFLLFYASGGEVETWDPDLDSDALSTLARRKDRLLRILKDLDEEKAMGSIEDSEHLRLRRSYKAKAVVALREFERVREARLRRLGSGEVNLSPDLVGRIEKKAAVRLRKLYADGGNS